MKIEAEISGQRDRRHPTAPATSGPMSGSATAGTAVTVPVTITNNGASPQELFLDPRLDTTATMTLPTIPPGTSLATLPNTSDQFPQWFVPDETSALTVTHTSTIPAMSDIGAGSGTAGSVVRGTLYIDALAGGLLPVTLAATRGGYTGKPRLRSE